MSRALAPLQRQTGKDPVERIVGEREQLRIAAEQAGTAATQGSLRQHAGGEIQPHQLVTAVRQLGQEKTGAAAQIQPAHRQISANRPVRHPFQQRLTNLLLEAGVGIVMTGGGAEAASKPRLVHRLEALIHGEPPPKWHCLSRGRGHRAGDPHPVRGEPRSR